MKKKKQSLDLLQAHLENGAEIKKQDGEWHLFQKDGEGIVSGKNIRQLLMNLVRHKNEHEKWGTILTVPQDFKTHPMKQEG